MCAGYMYLDYRFNIILESFFVIQLHI
jgi:hypothetical protein